MQIFHRPRSSQRNVCFRYQSLRWNCFLGQNVESWRQLRRFRSNDNASDRRSTHIEWHGRQQVSSKGFFLGSRWNRRFCLEFTFSLSGFSILSMHENFFRSINIFQVSSSISWSMFFTMSNIWIEFMSRKENLVQHRLIEHREDNSITISHPRPIVIIEI